MVLKKMMKNLKKELGVAIKTGKVLLGSKEVIRALFNGKLKLIIFSKNCPEKIFEKIRYYSILSQTSFLKVNENSQELGAMCGKPFSVSTLGIVEEGESSILDIGSKKKDKVRKG